MIKYKDEIWKTEEIKYNKCTINLALLFLCNLACKFSQIPHPKRKKA
jgi:hypothetical protein